MTIATFAISLVLLLLAGVAFWLITPDKRRTTLETRYGVKPEDYRAVAGLRLRVLDSGPRDAPILILLHGFASSLETWEVWTGPLAERFRVLRFDWPGFALTGPDPTGDYSDARALVVLASLMDQLGVARASLVGNSMGGKFAWMFAARHPGRVERLVLISPDGFASDQIGYGTKVKLPWRFHMMRYVFPKYLVRRSFGPSFADPAVFTGLLLRRYRDLMLAPGVRAAMLARLEQVLIVPPEPLLRQVEAPTLLLWGEKDRLIPLRNAAAYVRLIPDARLVTFPALGHVPQEEAPAAALAPVLAFLGQDFPRPAP